MYVEGSSFENFKAGIKSDETLSVYTYSINEFLKYSKIKNYDDLVDLEPKKIQKLIEEWIIFLSNKGLKPLTIRTKLSSIELFLYMNDVMVNKKKLSKLIPSEDYIGGGEIPYTTEEIQKMLSCTTKLRSKALIHFLACTGARPGAVADPPLKLKHVEKMPNQCKAFKLYEDSRQWYWAFLTPEASIALDDYLKSRKLNGEELTPESPVFANHNHAVWRRKNDFMSPKAVRELISNIIKAAGIERTKSGNRYDKAPVYGFRKRFNTILKVHDSVNSNIAEKLMAHKKGLDGSYFKPTREQCFTEFVKAIPELTITDEARDKIKIATLEDKSEIDKIKEELAEVRLWARIESEGKIAMGQALTRQKVNQDFPAYKEYLKKIKDAVKSGKAKDRKIIFKK